MQPQTIIYANSNYFITSKKIYHSFIVYSFWYINFKEAIKIAFYLFDFPLLELLQLMSDKIF